jgi:hypothetical protein
MKPTGVVMSPISGIDVDVGGLARMTRLALGRYSLWVEPTGDVSGKVFHGLEVNREMSRRSSI